MLRSVLTLGKLRTKTSQPTNQKKKIKKLPPGSSYVEYFGLYEFSLLIVLK